MGSNELIEIEVMASCRHKVVSLERWCHADFCHAHRLNPDAVRSPRDCDYLDIFTASDIETAAKVSALIRTFGHAQTEVWTVTEWDRFKEIVRRLPGSA